jgi:hypothetical protein
MQLMDNGFAELILSQVEKKIAYRMQELKVTFERSQMEIYKKAFMEGIKEGIDIGKNIDPTY